VTVVQVGAVRLELLPPLASGIVPVARGGTVVGGVYRIGPSGRHCCVVFDPYAAAVGGSLVSAVEKLADRLRTSEARGTEPTRPVPCDPAGIPLLPARPREDTDG
jgi:hypothetical protein